MRRIARSTSSLQGFWDNERVSGLRSEGASDQGQAKKRIATCRGRDGLRAVTLFCFLLELEINNQ
jgi:hypothetical protein